MNKKIKIWGLVLVILFVLSSVLSFINEKKNFHDVLVSYIKNIGFVQEENSSLYFKSVSDVSKDEFDSMVTNKTDALYEGLYFNIDSYKLTGDKLEYSDGVMTSFNPTYDYVNDILDYDYRINIEDTSVIIEGVYNEKNNDFTCDATYYKLIDIDNAINDICSKLKFDVERFRYDSMSLITRHDILEKIKNNDK